MKKLPNTKRGLRTATRILTNIYLMHGGVVTKVPQGKRALK